MSTKETVFRYLKGVGVDNTFSGFFVERINYKHPMSGTRSLRKLREEGKIDYAVVSKSKSIYKLLMIASSYGK